MADRFVLAATYADDTAYIWRFARTANGFVEWTTAHPDYHYTWIDGKRPHFTAVNGLEFAHVDPIIVEAVRERDSERKPKRHTMGWSSHWSDIDHIQPVGGVGFIYPDDFARFDAKPPSRRWRNRLVVPLEEDQGVQVTHFLAWPTDFSRGYVRRLCDVPGTVDVRILSKWEPWSVIHVQVTKPGAIQRPGDN